MNNTDKNPPLTRPDAILFDMDDTLVDATASYRTATVLTAKHFGVELGLSDVSKAKAAGDANDDWILTWRLINKSQSNVSLEEVTEVFERLYHGENGQPGLKDEEQLLLDVGRLKSLQTQFKLGIVTGRPRKDAQYLLDLHHLTELFGCVITFDDGPLKPDPHPVRMALEALQAQTAWFIGDTPDDMRAAVSAGITAIGVLAPSDPPGPAEKALRTTGAVVVLHRTEDLFELLDGLF